MMSTLSCGLKGQQQVIYFRENRAASCCRAYPTHMPYNFQTLQNLWQQERLDLDRGIRIPSCQVCWQDEDSGRPSYRQYVSSINGVRIELNMDNLCNHMCAYCTPRFSSRWDKDIVDNGPYQLIWANDKSHMMPADVITIDHKTFMDQLQDFVVSSTQPVTIAMHGGEPLMQIESLDRLLDIHCDTVTFEIITNLNPPSTRFLERILDRWGDVPGRLKFLISIDTHPKFNHVIRHGFDQDRFNRCLDMVNQSGCERSVNAVISVLSLLDIEAYLAWLDQQSLSVKFSTLNNPRSLQPTNLPRDMREQLQSRVFAIPPVVQAQLSAPESTDLERYACYHYLCQYFDRTGLEIDAVDHDLFHQFWDQLHSQFG